MYTFSSPMTKLYDYKEFVTNDFTEGAYSFIIIKVTKRDVTTLDSSFYTDTFTVDGITYAPVLETRSSVFNPASSTGDENLQDATSLGSTFELAGIKPLSAGLNLSRVGGLFDDVSHPPIRKSQSFGLIQTNGSILASIFNEIEYANSEDTEGIMYTNAEHTAPTDPVDETAKL